MAHTRTFPLDYQKRIIFIDHLKRLCNQCGGFCAPDHDNGGFFCMSCKSTDVAEVMESKVDDFRRKLQEARLPDATRMYIANCRICSLADAMKDCKACKFNVGLVWKAEVAK